MLTRDDRRQGEEAVPVESRRHRDRHRHLLRGSAWLTLALGTNAFGGFLFWLGAARITDAGTVGRATALFTGLLFVNYVTSLGLPIALARYAPDRSAESSGVFALAAVVSVVSSIAGTVVLVIVAPGSMTEALVAHGWWLGAAVVGVGSAGTALALLVEVRLVALRRGEWVFVRAAAVAACRLPFLAVGAVRNDAFWLFIASVAPIALSGFVGAAALLRVHGAGLRATLRATRRREATRYAAVNWLGLLAAQGPQFALPIIVAANVAPSDNAVFYVAWSITLIAFLLPQTLGQVLLVEGGRDTDLHSQVRFTLAIGFVMMAVVVSLSVLGRGALTAVYGDNYAAAADVLPLLLVAGLPWAVTSSLLARARVEQRSLATVAITASFAAGVLAPALMLTADAGVDGAARAWLIGNVVAVAVAAAVVRRPVPVGPSLLAGPD